MGKLSFHYIEHKVDSLIEYSHFFGKIFGVTEAGWSPDIGSGILGTITLEPFGLASELAQDETEADIRAFAVAPRAQGQGAGRNLLLAVIECAGKRGVCFLRLCTRPAMKAAQHLYTRTGFSRTPDLDFEPGPGIILRAYELALPSNPFPGPQPDEQPE